MAASVFPSVFRALRSQSRQRLSRHQEDTLELKKATMEDCRELYEIRNLPEVRKHILNPLPIEWGDHLAWFKKTISDPAKLLLVIISGSRRVGAVRFDYLSGSALVSIYLSPEVWGRGLGGEALACGEKIAMDHWPDLTTFTAVVLEGNTGSRKIFERTGYSGTGEQLSKRTSGLSV